MSPTCNEIVLASGETVEKKHTLKKTIDERFLPLKPVPANFF
jgi:hypothetical protein